jgi:hypothetical protein
MKRLLVLSLVLSSFSAGCAHSETVPRNNAPEYASSVKREVEATVREFFDGFGQATCTDGRPVAKFARDPLTFVLESEIYEIPWAEYEKGVRDLACTWKKHDGVVKSVVVEPFGPNAAVAAWTYRDDILLNSGETRNSNGATLMTLIKTDAGWRITSTKTTETFEPKATK